MDIETTCEPVKPLFDEVTDEPEKETTDKVPPVVEENKPVSTARKIFGGILAVTGATVAVVAAIGTGAGVFASITGVIGLSPVFSGLIIGAVAIILIVLGMQLALGVGPMGLMDEMRSLS